MKPHLVGVGFFLACLQGGAFSQTTIHVPGDQATIQQAIDASTDGDTVLVAPGTYHEQIAFGSHQVTVKSSDGPEVTTIDAAFLGPVVSFGPASTRQATIRGFTITHGSGNIFAGGVQIDQGSPTVQGNVITDNRGESLGNGISIEFSAAALVIDNQIVNNRNDNMAAGAGGGGGISVGGDPCGDDSCGAEIRNNVIENNSTVHFSSGGGIDLNSTANVKIIGNVIRGNSAPHEGGGIAVRNGSRPTIENNLIGANESEAGGGVYSSAPSRPSLFGNTIVDNLSTAGSAIYIDGSDPDALIVNNMAVAVPGITGIECKFAGFGDTPVLLSNDIYTTGASAYADLCSTDAGINGNISVEPIFVAANDYRLMPSSAGIDAGLNVFATESTDILGHPRILDGDDNGVAIIDMGAYELVPDRIFHDGFEPSN